MRFSIIPTLVIFSLLLTSCGSESTVASNKADTPISFINSIVHALEDKDEDQIWAHFMNKEQLHEKLKMENPDTNQIKVQLEDMWSAIEATKRELYQVFTRDGITEWSEVQIDSVRLALRTQHPLGKKDIPGSKVKAMGTLHVDFKHMNKHRIMLLPCMKMHSGEIRLVGYPRFKSPDEAKLQPVPIDSISRLPNQ